MLLPDEVVPPWWVHRQCDPSSPAFAVVDEAGSPENVTSRDWVTLGGLGDPARALVDPRGSVTPALPGWSVEWWVGGEDRWYFPALERTVRQRLEGDAPIITTAVRCGKGDITHTAWVVAGHGGSSWLALRVRNETAAAVAVALAVRPWNPLGRAAVHTVELREQTVWVDDAAALHLDRVPAEFVVGSVDHVVGRDPSAQLASGRDLRDSTSPTTVSDDRGLASAAVVFPLPHTLSLDVLVPLATASGRGRRGRQRTVSVPRSVPEPERVVSGWALQAGNGPRFDLPDSQIESLVAANRCHLLLAQRGDRVGAPGARLDEVDGAVVLSALDGYGSAAATAEVLAELEERQSHDGHLLGDGRRREAVGASLWALGEHWQLHRDDELVDDLVGAVAKAIHWLDRRTGARRARRGTHRGLLPDGAVPPWLGADGVTYRAAWWSTAGLRAVAPALVAVGQPEVAEDAARVAAELSGAVRSALADDARRRGDAVVASGPGRPVDGGAVGIVDAIVLGELAAIDEAATATLAYVAEHHVADGAVYLTRTGQGLSARLTARLGRARLALGDGAAVEQLSWMAEHATAAATWPETTNPRTAGGSSGAGHDPVAAAEMLLFARDLLVRWGPDGLVLNPVVPSTWIGQSWEVHDLPTPYGRLGFAVRWHGERPALLWELEPHPGVVAPPVTAPGLDPAWRGDGASGEALLAPVAVPLPEDVVDPPVADTSGGTGEPGEIVSGGLSIRPPRRDSDG
ncbi:MAG: hypothetical protein JJU45_03640 [Acidimicrobiia bacterium]|nr:hypothetical protein [Acidimicrobiia bacterium]